MLDRRAFVAGLPLVVPTLAAAAAAPPLPPLADLRGDARRLHEAHDALHPGLMRYNTAASLAANRAALDRELAACQTLPDAYLAFSRYASTIRCGHTFPNPVNQRRAVREALFGGRTVLPLQFRWLGGRMIVTRSLGEARLPPGAEVVEINGVAVSSLLPRLVALSRTDGHNEPKRLANLAVADSGRLPAFDVFAPMLIPGLEGVARLTWRSPAGAVRREEIALVTRAEREAVSEASAEAWTMEALPGGVHRLTMPTWAFFNGPKDWATRLDADLDRAADGRALILDLRANEGGVDAGDRILAHYLDRPVDVGLGQRKVRYRRTPAALDPILDTWDDSFRNWGPRADGPDAAGFYRLVEDGDDAPNMIRPAPRRHRGRLIVLTGPTNSSATFQFASAVKQTGAGVLVGETTGGNRRGINGGAFFFLRMPACGLEMDLPLIGYFPVRPQPDAGVEPDVPVRTSARDIAEGRDPVMAAALRLARG